MPHAEQNGNQEQLLEAMASELPCDVTPLALQGIGVTPGKEVLIGTNTDELATQVERVMVDEGLASGLARAAREHVRSRHSWVRAAHAYECIYSDVVGDRDARSVESA